MGTVVYSECWCRYVSYPLPLNKRVNKYSATNKIFCLYSSLGIHLVINVNWLFSPLKMNPLEKETPVVFHSKLTCSKAEQEISFPSSILTTYSLHFIFAHIWGEMYLSVWFLTSVLRFKGFFLLRNPVTFANFDSKLMFDTPLMNFT